MKVLIVSNAFPNSIEKERGVFTYQIVKELLHKCRVEVVAPLPWVPKKIRSIYLHAEVPYAEEFGGITVYHPRYLVIPKILGFMHAVFMFFPLLKLIRKLEKKEGFDLINAHWVFPDGVAACWVAKCIGKPIVLTALGCDINLYTRMFFRRLQISDALNRAEALTAVSNNIKERIIELGIQEKKIAVIPNGVNLELFKILHRNNTRKRLGLPEGRRIIVTVGSQDEVKGTKYLIEALGILMQKGDMIPYTILIGGGPLRDALIQQAKTLGVFDHVLFAGKKPHNEIPLWLNAADTFCLPSIREGHPNVVLEASACGVPVVASNVGGVSELIFHGKNGFLFEVGHVESLSDYLYQALLRKWDRLVIRRTVSKYSWDICSHTYLGIFTKIFYEHNSSKTNKMGKKQKCL